MREYMYIGETPHGEPCAQVGTENYMWLSRLECRLFVEQLLRQFGEPPYGADIVVKLNSHDFGSYLSVEVKYDSDIEECVEYAYLVEQEAPEEWDDISRSKLAELVDKGVYA